MSRTLAKDNDSTESMYHNSPRKEKESFHDKPLAGSLKSEDYDKDRMTRLRESKRVSGKRKQRAHLTGTEM